MSLSAKDYRCEPPGLAKPVFAGESGGRGLQAAWTGSTRLFVPSLSCLLCGGRLASFLASAPWLPAHFRSYVPSVALNLAQQSFSVHGLSGKGPLGR